MAAFYPEYFLCLGPNWELWAPSGQSGALFPPSPMHPPFLPAMYLSSQGELIKAIASNTLLPYEIQQFNM